MTDQKRSTLSVRVSETTRQPALSAAPACSPPVLEFIASDATLDRYDEVIVAEGWDLRHYLQNPVFQNAHNYGDVIHTLGRALVTEVRQGRLFQQIEFATDVNPLARIAYGLYKGKFLNAVSVGFIPLEWEEGTNKTPYRRKYLRQELIEVSAVGIPANPNALALGLRDGAIEKSDLRELAALLRQEASSAPARVTPEWLSIARTARRLLRKS